MIVKSFLTWMDRAGPVDRAHAVDMLARAFLTRALGGDRPEEVEAALTSVLDDPSPHVRKSLALVFADRDDAPRHIVQSLAADIPQVGAVLIARSPLLAEADLIELAFAVEGMSLVGIAMRAEVPRTVSQAVAKRRVFDAVLALARNEGAVIAEADLAYIASEFGERAELREALLARANLPAVVRYILVTCVAKRLGSFAMTGGFLAGNRGQRVVDETVQMAVLTIGERQRDQLPNLVRHLRIGEELTPGLLLRSVMGGDLGLLIAALADLTGLDLHRIGSLMQARTDAALSALLRRADLPAFLTRPLIAAIRAAGDEANPRLSGYSLSVIRAAQGACRDIHGEEGVRLLALLRRYEAEAARSDSRRLADDLRTRAREEFSHFTLKADQVRQLEELEAEERFGTIRPYEEIGFEPDYRLDQADIADDPAMYAGPAPSADDPVEFVLHPSPTSVDSWSDVATARFTRIVTAPRSAGMPTGQNLGLRPDILPQQDIAETATQPHSPEPKRPSTDLRSLITEWRRECEERDRARGIAPNSADAPAPANEDLVSAVNGNGRRVA